MNKYIKMLAVIVLSSFLLYSCSDDDSNPVNGGETTIKGRVTSSSYGNSLQKTTAGIEGAVVTTAEIKSDGTLQMTSDAGVTTNANGEFELETSTAGKSNIVIIAEKGNEKWKAIVSSNIEAEQRNYSQPLNAETTAEADVYAEIVSKNKANAVGYYNVAYHINSAVAAEVNGSASVKTTVADAIITEAEARSQVLTNSHYGYSSAQVNAAMEAEAEAQKNLESNLYLSSDTEASYQLAMETYINALVSAYNNTSIAMADLAQSREISGKAMLKLNNNLSSDLKFQLTKRNAYLKAKLTAKAVSKEHETAGANSQQMQEVEEDNNNLILSVKNSTSVSGINQAFNDYRASIKANLKTSFSALASSFIAVETAIETIVKVGLETAVNSAQNVQSVIAAYAAFDTSVNATLTTELNLSDDVKLKAFANIYTLIYMNN